MDIKVGRYTANYPDEFVVFLIGLRINQWWRVNEWVPIYRAATAMDRELRAAPDSPLLQSQTMTSTEDFRLHYFLQHWRSYEELEDWANDRNLPHRPAQREFFRRTAYNGHVGVWHETYRVAPGQFEALYLNMPRISMAAAGEYRPVREASRLRDRMGNGLAE